MTGAPPKLCACGCGTPIAAAKTFAHGHHRRGTLEVQVRRAERHARRRERSLERARWKAGEAPPEKTGAPPGTPPPTQAGARLHRSAAGREPLKPPGAGLPAPPRPREASRGARRLSGAIDALVDVLGEVEAERRERVLRGVLVEVRAGLYRLDVLRGRVPGGGIEAAAFDEEDRASPGPGSHGRGKGGRTEREPRHRDRGPHEWHWPKEDEP